MNPRDEWNKAYTEIETGLTPAERQEILDDMRRRRKTPRTARTWSPFLRRTSAIALLFLLIWTLQGLSLQPMTWIAAFGGAFSFNTLWEVLAHTGRPRWPGIGLLALIFLMYLPQEILAVIGYSLFGLMLLLIAVAYATEAHKQIPMAMLMALLIGITVPTAIAALTYIPGIGYDLPLRVLALANCSVYIAIFNLTTVKTLKPLPFAF